MHFIIQNVLVLYYILVAEFFFLGVYENNVINSD